MRSRVWHNGPPPHVGWWNATASRSSECWRWWNGEEWSMPAYPWQVPLFVEQAAGTASVVDADRIEWSRYWPRRARVKRVAP